MSKMHKGGAKSQVALHGHGLSYLNMIIPPQEAHMEPHAVELH